MNSIIECLAELEHDQWMQWANTLLRNEILSQARVQRWQLMMVPYAELPEEMKEHDRIWARKVLEIMEEA